MGDVQEERRVTSEGREGVSEGDSRNDSRNDSEIEYLERSKVKDQKSSKFSKQNTMKISAYFVERWLSLHVTRQCWELAGLSRCLCQHIVPSLGCTDLGDSLREYLRVSLREFLGMY